MAGVCDHGDDTSGSIKADNLLTRFIYQMLKVTCNLELVNENGHDFILVPY
jgi:hypothetical protein